MDIKSDILLQKAEKKASEIFLQIQPTILAALGMNEKVRKMSTKKATVDEALEYQITLALLASKLLANALFLKTTDTLTTVELFTKKDLINMIIMATELWLNHGQEVFDKRG